MSGTLTLDGEAGGSPSGQAPDNRIKAGLP